MERIEVSKAATGENMIRIQGPNGAIFCHPAALEPISPAEYRELVAKSAEREETDEQQPDPENDCFDELFTNTQTTFAAEL